MTNRRDALALCVAALLAASGCSRAVKMVSEGTGITLGTGLIGKTLPTDRLAYLNGKSGSLADCRTRAMLVNVWATWCGPCVREMPRLQRLSRAYARRGFAVVGIDDGESRSAVKRFVRSLGVTYPIFLDPEQSYVDRLHVLGLPTSIMVRADGKVDAVVVGELSYERMEQLAHAALQGGHGTTVSDTGMGMDE